MAQNTIENSFSSFSEYFIKLLDFRDKMNENLTRY